MLRLIVAFVSVMIFALGFRLGRKEGISYVENALFRDPGDGSEALDGYRLGHGLVLRNIIDIVKSQPQVDLHYEYDIDLQALDMYPKPLKSQIAIVNVDTRGWSPWDTPVERMEPHHWGYYNHYLYAEMHGYTFLHLEVPADNDRHATWVKVREQFRLTMQDKYKFVIVLDADMIFNDLRVPMEALLGHWNVTEEIAITGGQDIPSQTDPNGRVLLNTGFIISQNTPDFPALMRDWIDCPMDVKYKGCSHWKNNWAHEQSALSNLIRYDYPHSIRELPLEEVHTGKFLTHYWSGEKHHLKEAALQSILGENLAFGIDRLAGTWPKHHEHVQPAMHDDLIAIPTKGEQT